VASIASTVRTRASNVIQIAYIPGVTNRSGPTSPSHLVPPVPPLPYSDSPVGSQFPRSPNIDIQFAADDLLRGSMVTFDNRSSVATTIYGGNAVVTQPNIIRAGKAAVVTVHSKGGSSVTTSSTGSPNPGSRDSTSIPPVPALFTKTTGGPSSRGKGAGSSELETVPPSPTFSIGSTFLNRLNTNTGPDAQSPRRLVPGRARDNNTLSVNYDSDDSSDLVPGHRGNALLSQRSSGISSCITDMDASSPFSDAHSMTLEAIPISNGSHLALADNNKRRSTNLIDTSERTVSPFDDSHSVDKLHKSE
jgi:hypothetical protein